jgi:hypothetical protein
LVAIGIVRNSAVLAIAFVALRSRRSSDPNERSPSKAIVPRPHAMLLRSRESTSEPHVLETGATPHAAEKHDVADRCARNWDESRRAGRAPWRWRTGDSGRACAVVLSPGSGTGWGGLLLVGRTTGRPPWWRLGYRLTVRMILPRTCPDSLSSCARWTSVSASVSAISTCTSPATNSAERGQRRTRLPSLVAGRLRARPISNRRSRVKRRLSMARSGLSLLVAVLSAVAHVAVVAGLG